MKLIRKNQIDQGTQYYTSDIFILILWYTELQIYLLLPFTVHKSCLHFLSNYIPHVIMYVSFHRNVHHSLHRQLNMSIQSQQECLSLQGQISFFSTIKYNFSPQTIKRVFTINCFRCLHILWLVRGWDLLLQISLLFSIYCPLLSCLHLVLV